MRQARFYAAPDCIDYTIKIGHALLANLIQPRQNAAVLRSLSIYLSITAGLYRLPCGAARAVTRAVCIIYSWHLFNMLNIFLILHHISQHMALIFNVSGYADLVKYVLEMRLYCVFGKVHLVGDH